MGTVTFELTHATLNSKDFQSEAFTYLPRFLTSPSFRHYYSDLMIRVRRPRLHAVCIGKVGVGTG